MRELKQSPKAVSQRAYYQRLKERRAKEAAETDQAIVDVCALNGKLEAENKRVKEENQRLSDSVKALEKHSDKLADERNRALKEQGNAIAARDSETDKLNEASLAISNLREKLNVAEKREKETKEAFDLMKFERDAANINLKSTENELAKSKRDFKDAIQERNKAENELKAEREASLNQRNGLVEKYEKLEKELDGYKKSEAFIREQERLASNRRNKIIQQLEAFGLEADHVTGKVVRKYRMRDYFAILAAALLLTVNGLALYFR